MSSIQVAMLSMGYKYPDQRESCQTCAHGQFGESAASGRCNLGRFYVVAGAICGRYKPRASVQPTPPTGSASDAP